MILYYPLPPDLPALYQEAQADELEARCLKNANDCWTLDPATNSWVLQARGAPLPHNPHHG